MVNIDKNKKILLIFLILISFVGCTKTEERDISFVCNTKDFESFHKLNLKIDSKPIKNTTIYRLDLNIIISNAKTYLFEVIGEMDVETLEKSIKNKKLNEDTIEYLNSLDEITSYRVVDVDIEIESLLEE